MDQSQLDKSSKPNQRKSDDRLTNGRRSWHPEQQPVEDALLFMEDIIRCSSSAIAACDLEGNMTYGNPAFHQMWGFDDPKEHLGKPYLQFWLVEDRLDEIMQALRGDGLWFDKIKARRKDGTIFDVQVSASMVYDRDGDPVALSSTSIDITKQKQVENFLIESEQRLRLATNTAGLAIWDWDISTNTVVWDNPWQNLIDGPLQRENAYEWWAERIHPDDRDGVFSIFNKALTNRDESLVMEYRFQCTDGTWSNVYNRSQIFRNQSGQAYRIIGALMDVTNLRRAEEELRRAFERLPTACRSWFGRQIRTERWIISMSGIRNTRVSKGCPMDPFSGARLCMRKIRHRRSLRGIKHSKLAKHITLSIVFCIKTAAIAGT